MRKIIAIKALRKEVVKQLKITNSQAKRFQQLTKTLNSPKAEVCFRSFYCHLTEETSLKISTGSNREKPSLHHRSRVSKHCLNVVISVRVYKRTVWLHC